MSKPVIQVTISDSAGVQQTFTVRHVELHCGCGCIDIRPGQPAFCRGFDHGVLTLDDGTTVTTLDVTKGMASLAGNVVQVICEHATSGHPAWAEHPISPASESRLDTTTPLPACPCNDGNLTSGHIPEPEKRTPFRANQRNSEPTNHK